MKPSRALPVAGVFVVVLAALAVVASLRDAGPGPGEAQVTVHGVAQVTRSSGHRQVVRDSVFLHRGDALTVVSGSADFTLADSVGYQAVHRPGSRAPRVVMGFTPELAAGELLVTTSSDTKRAAKVMTGGTAVALAPSSGGTAMRVASTYATTVSVYRGAAHVDSAGAVVDVPAFRLVEVPALGRVSRRTRPLDVDPNDRWDRRFLGPAIAIDMQLVPVLAGWARSGGAGWSAAQLRAALPGQPAELPALSSSRSGGETMVAAAISGLGRHGSYAERWKKVFAFHDAGATWGLVAMDQEVSAAFLLGAISAPIDSTPFPYPDTAVAFRAPARGLLTTLAELVAGAASPAGTTGTGTAVPADVTTPGATTAGDTSPSGGPGAPPRLGTQGDAGGSSPGTVGGPAPTAPGTSGGSSASSGSGGGLGLPPVTVPSVSLPPVTFPPVSQPPLTLPPLTLPPVTLPPVTTPLLTTPSVTLPPLTVPVVNVPAVNVPAVTVPAVNLPGVTAPTVTLPPVTLPPPSVQP